MSITRFQRHLKWNSGHKQAVHWNHILVATETKQEAAGGKIINQPPLERARTRKHLLTLEEVTSSFNPFSFCQVNSTEPKSDADTTLEESSCALESSDSIYFRLVFLPSRRPLLFPV